MTAIEVLNDLHKTGGLKVLLDAGLISPKVLFYRDVFLLVDIEIKTGSEKMVAYQTVSDKYNVHIDTIRNAVAAMSK